MWRPQVVEVGAGSRSRSRQEPQIAEAGAGSRSRSGKEVQRPRLKTTILRSDESSSVHEESRSGSLELAADERNQIQEAGNPQIWIPPQKGAYKVNIDGSYTPGSKKNFVACICRDSGGRMVGGAINSVRASSPLMTETLALWEALNAFFSRRHEEMIFESDNLQLVKAMNSSEVLSWETQSIV
ncbi:hypothetical protein EUGRSUZ_E01727, partial [Eucalyptus grandis]